MDSSYSTLEQDPFGPGADARYVYLNRRQEELLVSLISALGDGDVRLLVTGSEGVGKSAFLLKLAEVLYTSGDFALLGHEMVFPCRRDTPLEAIEAAMLEHAVLRDGGMESAQSAVLLLDDADRLDPAVLTNLWQRWPELNAGWSSMSVVMSAMPQPKQLRARSEHGVMAAEQTFELPPLEPADVEGLIRHRLQVAGLSGLELFSPDALERISYFSKRVPARIVQLCGSIFSKLGPDLAVPVSGDVVKGVAYNLFLPGHLQKLARGLSSQPKPSRTPSDAEPQWDLDVSANGGGERDDHAPHSEARAVTAREGSDHISMSPQSTARAVSAAARSSHPWWQYWRPRMQVRSLASAGAVLLLIAVAVVAFGFRQDDQLVKPAFEAAIAPADRTTGNVRTEQSPDAEQDAAAAPSTMVERKDNALAQSASPAAPLPEPLPEVMFDEASRQAPQDIRAQTATGDGADTPGRPRFVESDDPAGATGAAGSAEASGSSAADQALATVEPRRPPPLVELNTVALVQSQLNALGYSAGRVDGIMGPRTQSAIRRFQANAGLPVDGRMSDTLVASLRRQSSKANLQNQRRERPRRRFMPAIRGQLDSVGLPQEFKEYCRANHDTWVFDRGKGKLVFCADVVNER